MRQSPIALTLIPFSRDSTITANGAMFNVSDKVLNFGDVIGPFEFTASQIQIHLLIMTVFIAFIAPFGGFFVAGLKRALRANQLGVTLHKGGVIDRVDCILCTGFFLIIYINILVYQVESDPKSQVKQIILSMSTDAQKALYWKLRNEMTGSN